MKQICKVCKIEQDLHTAFYASVSKSGYDTTCKDCRKVQQKQRKKRRGTNKPASNPHESAFLQACLEHGIYADHATVTKHRYCDVIAWGCVRIEVKYPDISNNGNLYTWRFTVSQARKRLPVDLIVLVTECFGGTNYHIFNPLHPVFFNADQTRKIGVNFTVERSAYYPTGYGVIMTRDILMQHIDEWNAIERVRLEISKQLKYQATEQKK